MGDKQTKPLVVAAAGGYAPEWGVGPEEDQNGRNMALRYGRCKLPSGAERKCDQAGANATLPSSPGHPLCTEKIKPEQGHLQSSGHSLSFLSASSVQ